MKVNFVRDATHTGVLLHAGVKMTLVDQSPREAQRTTEPIIAPKQQNNIGYWNARTMAETARTARVSDARNKRENDCMTAMGSNGRSNGKRKAKDNMENDRS